jgi:hypothetical protein
MLKVRYYWLAILCWIGFSGFHSNLKQRATYSKIQFVNTVGDSPLQLFDKTYTNPFGEPFELSKFKYYISHLSYVDEQGRTTNMDGNYFLVNEEDSGSKSITLASASAIRSISFMIGVDSMRNISGVQTGSLDPANGMFWTWNSGYIFAKLEGRSDSSRAPAHSFSWHIGGFKKNQNAARFVTLSIPVNGASSQGALIIRADVLAWFNAVHALRISQSPLCHQPGELAMKVADNFSQMFSVE